MSGVGSDVLKVWRALLVEGSGGGEEQLGNTSVDAVHPPPVISRTLSSSVGVFSDAGLQAIVREEKWRTITDSIIMLWVDIATVEQVRTETVVDLLPWLLSPCPGLTFLSSAVSAG